MTTCPFNLMLRKTFIKHLLLFFYGAVNRRATIFLGETMNKVILIGKFSEKPKIYRDWRGREYCDCQMKVDRYATSEIITAHYFTKEGGYSKREIQPPHGDNKTFDLIGIRADFEMAYQLNQAEPNQPVCVSGWFNSRMQCLIVKTVNLL